MAIAASSVTASFVDAVVARDFAGARELLHEEIDFRAMTPNVIWEADGPADVEATLREWLADPDEEIHSIEAVEPCVVEDTTRLGWIARGTNSDGHEMVFEQLAYAREREGKVGWLRVVCSGPRPTGESG
jgi:hypothetical protein